MSTKIINMALDLLKEEPYLDPNDRRNGIQWMLRNYPLTRDALIRKHPWNCAMHRAVLPAMSDAPLFGWKFQYAIPSECLRVLPLADLGAFNGRSVPFKVEGRAILTDAKAPLRVQFLRQIDETIMDAMFRKALAASLAAEGAHWFTGKSSMVEQFSRIASQATLEGQMIDGLEGTPDQPDGDDWLDARFGVSPI